MRIAVPVTDHVLHPHFGHCAGFALLDVDPTSRAVVSSTEVVAPEHQPGLLPRWLKERGVTTVIAGNMGVKARIIFQKNAIEVCLGAPSGPPLEIAREYLAGTLVTSATTCHH
jgi:predicted Fe-Mo cluster-binding NifX family protein